MKALNIITVALGYLALDGFAADAIPWERLDRNNSVLLIVDLQVGLYLLARDFDPTLYWNNMIAHAALGKLLSLPVVMTTSAQDGPNGPLPKEILQMAAVEATVKKQVVLAGIVTDVCTTFLALSLRAQGYSVWANVEASGTINELIRSTANDQMRHAGVQVVSLFAIIADLMRTWAQAPPGTLEFFGTYLPGYGNLAKAHLGAVMNGTIQPGEEALGRPGY